MAGMLLRAKRRVARPEAAIPAFKQKLRDPAPKGVRALLGEAAWLRLPEPVRRRFGADAGDADYVGWGLFEANDWGALCARIGSIFGRPLPHFTGRARIAVSVRGRGGLETWTRAYHFAAKAETIVSQKLYSPRGLVERARGLEMRIDLLEERGKLVFLCRQYALRLFGASVPLPVWAGPGRIRVEHIDRGAGRFAFTLEAIHPWFGVTLRQICELQSAPQKGEIS